MRKNVARYPIDGTAALQIEINNPTACTGTIIAFPETKQLDPQRTRTAQTATSRHITAEGVFRGFVQSATETDMVQSLRYGTAKGQAFNRFTRMQAFLVGLFFTVVSFGTLFLSLL